MTETTLGSLVKSGALRLGDGYRTKRSELAESGYRIIRVADVTDGCVDLSSPDFVDAAYAKAIGDKAAVEGDVLLTTKGTVGRVAVMPATTELAVYSPQLCFFRVLDPQRIDPRFLRYWFSSAEFWNQARDRMNNTDMAAYINLADVRSMSVTLPPLPAQRAIAEVLGALDDKIAANTHLASAAEMLAVALVSALPLGTTLGALVTHHRTMVSPESLADPVVEHFSLPSFDSGKRPELAAPSSIKSGKFAIDQPSVLISKLNPRIPRIWLTPASTDIPQLASTEFLVLVPRALDSAVLWALAMQPSFSAALEGKVAGTSGSHQRVKPDDLLDTPIGDPTVLSETDRSKIVSLCASAQSARAENTNLAATRDALLPALMPGRLRVKDAEKVVSDAV